LPSKPARSTPPAYPTSLIVHAELSAKRRVLVRLLVDTGATYTMIPLRAALAIGMNSTVAAKRIPLVTVSAVEYPPLVTLPSLTCLGHQLRQVEVVCHDLPPQSAVEGLLGLNVLLRFPAFRTFIESIQAYLV